MTITSYWPTHTNLTPITTTRDRFVGYKVFIFAIVCKLRLVTPELSPDKFIDFVDILEEEYKTRPNAFYLEDVTAGHLLASIDHAFHHLNFAWNARYGSMPAVDSDTRFYANEKWPRAARFLRFWPDRWVRAIRKAHQKGVQTRRNKR